MSLAGALRARTVRLPGLALPGTTALEARGVSVAYGPRAVLDDVDLSVRAGELIVLVGPNGAGKSTLLAVLSGDLAADSGTVHIDGQPLHHWRADELAVRRGVLLQHTNVSFPFTVTQIVRMGRAPWSGTPAEEWDDDVVAHALDETDVAHFAPRVFTSLSGGERARAAFARVLAQEPTVLLLDEPTAALDIRHQELMLRVARGRAARGDAVLVVMHDLALAAAYADVIVVMCDGRIRAHGAPAAVLTESLLSDVYEYPIEIIRHPRTGALVILPCREVPGTADDLLAPRSLL